MKKSMTMPDEPHPRNIPRVNRRRPGSTDANRTLSFSDSREHQHRRHLVPPGLSALADWYHRDPTHRRLAIELRTRRYRRLAVRKGCSQFCAQMARDERNVNAERTEAPWQRIQEEVDRKGDKIFGAYRQLLPGDHLGKDQRRDPARLVYAVGHVANIDGRLPNSACHFARRGKLLRHSGRSATRQDACGSETGYCGTRPRRRRDPRPRLLGQAFRPSPYRLSYGTVQARSAGRRFGDLCSISSRDTKLQQSGWLCGEGGFANRWRSYYDSSFRQRRFCMLGGG